MIDSHIHLGKTITNYFYGIQCTIKDLERLYVNWHGLVIMPTEEMKNHTVARQVAKSHLNAKFFAWVEPRNLKRVKKLDFDGMKLHPAYSDVPVTHKTYDDIFNLAEERCVPVTIHSGDVERTNYKHIIERAKEYSKVKIIMGHSGGKRYQYTWEAPIEGERYKNLYFDTTMRFKYWMIEHCCKMVGSERMLFGSDYPLCHPDVGVQAILSTKLKHKEKIDILDKTARRLLW